MIYFANFVNSNAAEMKHFHGPSFSLYSAMYKNIFLKTSLCKSFQCASASSNSVLKKLEQRLHTGFLEAGEKCVWKFKLKQSPVFDNSRHVGHIGWDPKGGFDVSFVAFSCKWAKKLSSI